MESTWEWRDLPVLRVVVEMIDRHGPVPGVNLREISEQTGLSIEDVRRATYALENEFIAPLKRGIGGDGGMWRVGEVYAPARQAVGQWPTPESLTDRIIDALEDTVANGETEEKRTRAQKLLAGLKDVGKEVLTAVIVKATTGAM